MTTTLLSQSAVVAIGGVVSCVVLFVLLIVCVCGDSDKGTEDAVGDARTSIPGTFQKNPPDTIDTNNVTINVDSSVSPVENGRLPPESVSRNSYRSSGSSPQPGGQRELPLPPISSSRETPGDEEEDADYDHLTMGGNNGGKRSSRYDHVTLTPEGNVQVEEHKTKGEPFYSEVNSKSVKDIEKTDLPSAEYIDDDADYATVNNGSDGSIVDVKRISVVKIKTVEDPYSELKDEVSGGSFMDIDPYSKVRGDLESDSGQSFNPYSKVKDDPYSMVREDDPYNKVDGDVDWLPNSPTDDPYNKVDESNMEGSSSGTSRVIDAYASVEPKSTRNNQITRINESQKTNVSHKGEAFCIVEEPANEYAVVMKSRSDMTPTPTLQNQFNFQSQDNDDHSSLPQEPPRRYNEYAEPDDSIIGSGSSLIQISSQRSSVVQSSSQRSSLVQNGGDISSPEQPINSNIGAAGPSQQQQQKREPPYHKITARESLASINQRLARNTYETVAETEADMQASLPPLETENFYATVEGGSGDGVVAHRTNRTRLNQSPTLDHYAEIGTTGVRQGNVPAPPSLDSLHIMTQSAEGRLPNGAVSPKGGNHVRNLSDQEDVTLDPNYQTVRDCISELAASSDPDYESVQEAESRGAVHIVINQNGTKLIRDHFYEEVKSASEADRVKKRVFKSHMYEDIDEVQEQKKQFNMNSRSEDVWKRRSDSEKDS